MQLVEEVSFACMPCREGSRQSNVVLPQGEMAKFRVFQWEGENTLPFLGFGIYIFSTLQI